MSEEQFLALRNWVEIAAAKHANVWEYSSTDHEINNAEVACRVAFGLPEQAPA